MSDEKEVMERLRAAPDGRRRALLLLRRKNSTARTRDSGPASGRWHTRIPGSEKSFAF